MLNFDCVRDLLVYLDENLEFKDNGKTIGIKMNNVLENDPLNKYSRTEISLAIEYLLGKDLIVKTNPDSPQSPMTVKVSKITPLGYEFLKTFKDNTVWNKLKKTSGDLAKFTIRELIALGISLMG